MTDADTISRVASIVRATPVNSLEGAGLALDLARSNLAYAESQKAADEIKSHLMDQRDAAQAEYERILSAMTGQDVDVIARRLG